MIIQTLLNLIMSLLKLCFNWINIPNFPEELTNSINSFLDILL